MKPFRYTLGGLLLVVTAWGYVLAYPQLCGLIALVVGVGVVTLLLLMALQLPMYLLFRASGWLPIEPDAPVQDQ